MIVELDHRNARGLSFLDWRHAHPDETQAQAAADSADSEAEQSAAEGTDSDQDAEDAPRTAEERVAALERAVDSIQDEAVFASEVGEFADKVDGHLADLNEDIEALETRLAEVDEQVQEQLGAFRDEMKDREGRVADMLQNSVKADTQAQADQNAERLATLQEAVNALGEQVEAATGHDGALGRVAADVQRLQGQDATVASYRYQQEGRTVTVHLQADLGMDRQADAERVPECNECGTPLGEKWKDANEKARKHDRVPAACPHCGGNPLPPVGGQQEDET
jgi:chromosome segregation ATPase